MPINARKLGPGSLTLGAGALAAQSQLTACKLSPAEAVETGTAVKVLSGESLDAPTSVSFTYALEGTFLQDDPGVSSVVDWSWDNAGTPQPFTFVPNTEGQRTITGTLYPVPLSLGGDDVDGDYMASDFTWRIDGEPVRSIPGP